MKLLTILSLVALAACGLRATGAAHPSWEPTFGSYAFEGSLAARPALNVSGTLSIGPQGYYLSSNYGSCGGRLERPWVGPDVEASCPGIRLVFRLAEKNGTEAGTAHVMVHQLQWSKSVQVPTEVRIQVRRAG